MDKGDEHKYCIHQCDDGHGFLGQSGDHHHHDQAEEQDRGADLAGHQRTVEDLTLAPLDCTGDQLEAFLDHKETGEIPQDGVPDRQTYDQRELGGLICYGIQEFSKGGGHIKMPGDLSVDHIGQAGYSQDRSSQIIVPGTIGSQIRIKINIHIDRDERQTEQTQHVRYGKYFFFPVFSEHHQSSDARETRTIESIIKVQNDIIK